jgi:carotenoid cleavage dioxygenase-like enzyme
MNSESVEPNAETQSRWLRAAWLPTSEEDDYEITEIKGEIPEELCGTLYRNGPSQRIAPDAGLDAMHLFDGDGMVHAFRFEDGRAWARNRFVRNEGFLREEREGRYCWNGVGAAANPALEGMRQQHNTNVVPHAGRLLAMVENAAPFEIDPMSLDARGLWPLDGRMVGFATSAHPKIDGRTGEMVIHGYQPLPPFVQLYSIDASGAVTLAEAVDAPYPAMMHDLAITERYAIFPLCPVVIDLGVVAEGALFADAIRWEPERGMFFGIRERRAGAETRWIEAPGPDFLFHFGNAYEDGDKVVVDACTYLDPAALLRDLRTIRAGKVGDGLRAVPFLYEIDLVEGSCKRRQLDDRSAEFPRHDDRLTGYQNRYGYAVTGGDRGPSALMRFDRSGAGSALHVFAPGEMPGEPIFVPRHRDAEESEGYVLSVVYSAPDAASSVVVLDAANIERAPLARLALRHRVPLGFHGNYAAADG